MWNWLALATEIIHQAGRGPGLLAACVWELVAAVTELQGVFAHWQVSTVHSHGAAPALCRVIWWISQQHFLFHGPLFLSSAASTSPTKHLHPWGSLEVPALEIRIQNQFHFKAGSDWWLSCSLTALHSALAACCVALSTFSPKAILESDETVTTLLLPPKADI